MILKLILDILGTIITVIVNMVNGLMPQNNLNTELMNIIGSILGICQQGVNCLYFIFGDLLFVVVPVAILLLSTKFIVVPIVELTRGFFINSTE